MRLTNGFTLIEVVCVLVIAGLLGLGMTLGLDNVVKGFLQARDTAKITQNAQLAMNRLSYEFSHMCYYSSNSTGSITTMPSNPGTSITYNNAACPRAAGTPTPVQHTISYSAGSKQIQIDGTPLADMVSAFTMRYFQSIPSGSTPPSATCTGGTYTAATTIGGSTGIHVICVSMTIGNTVTGSKTFSTYISPLDIQ